MKKRTRYYAELNKEAVMKNIERKDYGFEKRVDAERKRLEFDRKLKIFSVEFDFNIEIGDGTHGDIYIVLL